MNYETTLTTVRDLSEHRLKRSPLAQIISRYHVARTSRPAPIVPLPERVQRQELQELGIADRAYHANRTRRRWNP